MGIAPYKTFTFDGVSSASYGVYLTGEGVFNAPERAVEMITIPNRNGAFAMDLGRFENISVTYKAGMFDVNESNFATKMSNFRNWICSKVGYCRLEDDYNPSEYRMAIYKEGIEVDHDLLIAGEFEITFECKPQRWLKSGETATAIANNGTLSNPTPFASSPLLAVKGYGSLSFNGYEMEIENALYGDFYLADGDTWESSKTYALDIDTVNIADTIDVSGNFQFVAFGYGTPASDTITDSNASFTTTKSYWQTTTWPMFGVQCNVNSNVTTTITVGTNKTLTNTMTLVTTFGPVTWTYTATQTVQYDSGASTITVSETVSASSSNPSYPVSVRGESGTITILVHSTASALGNPTYIDCDIGECYRYKSDNTIMVLNNVVVFGSQLPVLDYGSNTFTYDNTITELKVTPRWWQV